MTEEQLDEIESMARLMLTKREIAVIIETDEDDFLSILEDKTSIAWRRFQMGRTKSQAEVRMAIFQLASAGSSPAQIEAMKLINEAKLDDL